MRPVVLPLHNYEKMRIMLEGEKNVTVDRNAWKRREWRLGEDVGWDTWEVASLTYFRCELNALLRGAKAEGYSRLPPPGLLAQWGIDVVGTFMRECVSPAFQVRA